MAETPETCTSRDCQFVHDHSRPSAPEDVYRAARRVRDLAFNALSRALAAETRAFVSLIERERIADAVVTAIETEIRASAYAAGREAAAQAIEAELAAREAQGCTYVRIADVRQALAGEDGGTDG